MRQGDDFAGYRIVRRLGVGGMGEVYLAQHPRLPRQDALKVLNPMFADAEEFRRRFTREAHLASSLTHPNVVPVYDAGNEAGRLWISMAYIEGTDCSQLLKLNRGPLGSRDAVRIVRETAAALDFAHGKKIVHRDVKPANILIGLNDRRQLDQVLLTDFGIARPMDPAQTMLTTVGGLMGTIAYSSPEALIDGVAGPRSDQYSLACSLFQLLTNTLPFDSTREGATSSRLRAAPSVSMRTPSAPRMLDDVLARAMAVDPARRFATCGEFADAVANVLEARAVTMVPPPRLIQATMVEVPGPGAWPPQPLAPGPAHQPLFGTPQDPYTNMARARNAPLTVMLVLLGALVVIALAVLLTG